MNGQDWEPVIFRKSQTANTQKDPLLLRQALRNGTYETQIKVKGEVRAQSALAKKFEADTVIGSEAVQMKLPALTLAQRKEMLEARTKKELTQNQLAQVRVAVIHEIESGKPTTGDMLSKINRILGTQLKLIKG
jgi:ribosome-binding protein aMBF1 (putative translation factor)